MRHRQYVDHDRRSHYDNDAHDWVDAGHGAIFDLGMYGDQVNAVYGLGQGDWVGDERVYDSGYRR